MVVDDCGNDGVGIGVAVGVKVAMRFPTLLPRFFRPCCVLSLKGKISAIVLALMLFPCTLLHVFCLSVFLQALRYQHRRLTWQRRPASLVAVHFHLIGQDYESVLELRGVAELPVAAERGTATTRAVECQSYTAY